MTTANGSRSAASSPLWGPLPVTNVPVTQHEPGQADERAGPLQQLRAWRAARRGPVGLAGLVVEDHGVRTSTADRR